MIKQNTSGLYLKIQQIGCFFMSALDMAQLEAKKRNLAKTELTIKEINYIWVQAIAFKYIDEDNDYTMKNSAEIANLGAQALGLAVKFREIATDTGSLVPMYYSGIGLKRIDYRIEKILQSGPSKTHFRVVDENKKLIEDPHEPPIKKLASYYTVCYRVDEIDEEERSRIGT